MSKTCVFVLANARVLCHMAGPYSDLLRAAIHGTSYYCLWSLVFFSPDLVLVNINKFHAASTAYKICLAKEAILLNSLQTCKSKLCTIPAACSKKHLRRGASHWEPQLLAWVQLLAQLGGLLS